LQEAELKDIGRRNAQIRRSHDMEKKGLTVNYTLFDEEAELMKCLRNSTEERFGRLRAELWSLCEKHLERPAQLASDYVLARVYKHCLVFLDLDDLLGNRAMENEYYHFKDMFGTKARKADVRDAFFAIVRQIHTLKGAILSSQQQPDFLEQQGFRYNDKTLDDLFVKKFRDILDVSTDSSDDEGVQAEQEDEDQLGASAQHLSQSNREKNSASEQSE
jgi:hypothetical protein